MKRSPLLAALVSGALAFQLVLAGGGVMCVGSGDEASHASATSPAEDHGPCDQPPSAPRSCQTMAPCAAGFVFVALAIADGNSQDASHIVAVSTPMPASRTVPPEPPPPRA